MEKLTLLENKQLALLNTFKKLKEQSNSNTSNDIIELQRRLDDANGTILRLRTLLAKHKIQEPVKQVIEGV